MNTDFKFGEEKESYTIVMQGVEIKYVNRDNGESFFIGETIYDNSYKEQKIKSFNIDKDYGGIRVDCEKSYEGNNSHSFCSIHKKSDLDREIYLAEELLLNNGFSIKSPDGTFKGCFHVICGKVGFYGKPSVIIKGEGYMPIKKALEAINHEIKPPKPNKEEIKKASDFLKSKGYKVIDGNKKWTDEDVKNAVLNGLRKHNPPQGYDHALSQVNHADEYINSINNKHE